jgi:hypothetical protein
MWLLVDFCQAQEPKPVLGLLAGNWAGTLTYLNYRDNKSRVTLETKAVSTIEADTIKMQFEYTEPSGKLIPSSDWLWLSPDGNSLCWDGESDAYKVSKLVRSDSSMTLIVQKVGVDNNKKATIRKTILVRGKTLTIAKQVRYQKTRKFVTRNTYSFIRQ